MGNVVHVFPSTQLGVRYVQKVGSSHQFTQDTPCADVRLVVGRVPVLDAAPDWNGPLRRGRQQVEQLLQVGPVVLVVAMGNAMGRFSIPPLSLGVYVLPGQRDGRAVVVQLLEIELKAPRDLDDSSRHYYSCKLKNRKKPLHFA